MFSDMKTQWKSLKDQVILISNLFIFYF